MFIEIVSPVADALGELADLVTTTSGDLKGASLGKSERGTVLLNARAWELFGDELRRRLPQMVVHEPSREGLTPIRFILVSSDEAPGR